MFTQTILTPDLLEKQLHARMQTMKCHPVFGFVRTIEDLRTFMSWHVFAVWDFMSLLKRLQMEFTSMRLPWTPPRSYRAARLITEIALEEECDATPEGGHASHFALYLSAMKEVGASTSQADNLAELVSCNVPVEQALCIVGAPIAVKTFVQSTINTARNGTTVEVLGSFLYGREDVIPEMFRNLLKEWSIDFSVAPTFIFYLNRHIELDAGSHGPSANALIGDIIAGDAAKQVEMLSAALIAVEQRINLWDQLHQTMCKRNEKKEGSAPLRPY